MVLLLVFVLVVDLVQGMIVVDVKLGVLGVGCKGGLNMFYSEVNENFKLYGVGVYCYQFEIECQFVLVVGSV